MVHNRKVHNTVESDDLELVICQKDVKFIVVGTFPSLAFFIFATIDIDDHEFQIFSAIIALEAIVVVMVKALCFVILKIIKPYVIMILLFISKLRILLTVNKLMELNCRSRCSIINLSTFNCNKLFHFFKWLGNVGVVALNNEVHLHVHFAVIYGFEHFGIC